MKISVVMSVYNEKTKELDESIDSILNQTYSDFEYIIIDDNPSSINIRNLLLLKQRKDKRIKIIFNRINLGVTKSINKGIYYSKGEFIARMDADDIATKDRFMKQLSFIENNELDLICSNFSDLDTKIKYFGNKNMIDQNSIVWIMSHCNIAMGPTLFLKKSVIILLKGYRNILTEDYDLVVRVLLYGYSVGYQSESFVYKRNRSNNLSNNNGLIEFVINDIISNSLSKNKIQSLYYINNKINSINKTDVDSFNNFKIYYNAFKNNKTILNLFNICKYTFSSKLVFKRNIWMLFVNKKYKNYI